MRRHSATLVMAGLLCGLALGACARPRPVLATAVKAPTERDSLLADQDLHSRIHEALYASDDLDASRILVRVRDLDVWLYGEVPSARDEVVACRVARSLAAVHRLHDDLEVLSGPPTRRAAR